MRLMISGSGSGCGKTTVALAMIAALRREGLSVQPFKAGPDYIDPGFLSAAASRPAHNLDPFLMDPKAIAQVYEWGMRGADCALIEGAMGYYDGIGPEGRASACELARQTQTPTVLVLNASGSASSLAATALGFRDYLPDNGIAAVFLNGISGPRHYDLARESIERRTGLPCVGWLSRNAGFHWDSRHLGLVQAGEQADLTGQIEALAQSIHLELERLMPLMASARPIPAEPMADVRLQEPYRMGVARDEAFSFYYEANLEMLRRMGMELIPFSPLRDPALPEGLDGLYLGGGYPELHLKELGANRGLLDSLRAALETGLHCYAECGGLMLLCRSVDGVPLTGFLPIDCEMTDRLQRFGYVSVRDTLSGLRFPAHEFHRSRILEPVGLSEAFEIRKAADARMVYRGGYRSGNVLAGYPHVHFWGRPELVKLLWGLDEDRQE